MNEVANFFGYSIGIGIVVSSIIEFVKFTQRVPFIGHWAPVAFVVNAIQKGKPMQIRIGVAILCTILNVISFFVNGGEVLDPVQFAMGFIATFNSILAATGTFNLVFEPVEKLDK